jgi:hypothetical protein
MGEIYFETLSFLSKSCQTELFCWRIWSIVTIFNTWHCDVTLPTTDSIYDILLYSKQIKKILL